MAFDEYVLAGGMAGSYLYQTKEAARKYLEGIVRATIAKGISARFKIKNEGLLNIIIDFIMDNIGSKTYIQVGDEFTSKAVKKREITPLFAIRDAYPNAPSDAKARLTASESLISLDGSFRKIRIFAKCETSIEPPPFMFKQNIAVLPFFS